MRGMDQIDVLRQDQFEQQYHGTNVFEKNEKNVLLKHHSSIRN